jgi:hypothetical protein
MIIRITFFTLITISAGTSVFSQNVGCLESTISLKAMSHDACNNHTKPDSKDDAVCRTIQLFSNGGASSCAWDGSKICEPVCTT